MPTPLNVIATFAPRAKTEAEVEQALAELASTAEGRARLVKALSSNTTLEEESWLEHRNEVFSPRNQMSSRPKVTRSVEAFNTTFLAAPNEKPVPRAEVEFLKEMISELVARMAVLEEGLPIARDSSEPNGSSARDHRIDHDDTFQAEVLGMLNSIASKLGLKRNPKPSRPGSRSRR